MNFLNRIVGTTAATLALTTGGIALASTASAATATAQACKYEDGGVLCAKRTTVEGHTAVVGSFLNQSSTTKNLQFTLTCSSVNGIKIWSGNTVSISPGRVYSVGAVFSIPANIAGLSCAVGFRDLSSVGWHSTPSI
ncbi:hypothetical protein [Kitasatospora indigofera]|uniref:hypothetical protein n=1 Tax=Kitasatospora indigofera TaxID=67307 RepID=UPI0036C2B53A